jgi:hypothetical protein
MGQAMQGEPPYLRKLINPYLTRACMAKPESCRFLFRRTLGRCFNDRANRSGLFAATCPVGGIDPPELIAGFGTRDCL